MIWLLCVQVVFGANQWEGKDSSVEVSRLFRADGPSIYAQFDELEDLATLYPERCVNVGSSPGQTLVVERAVKLPIDSKSFVVVSLWSSRRPSRGAT